jgi:hypothetical protein
LGQEFLSTTTGEGGRKKGRRDGGTLNKGRKVRKNTEINFNLESEKEIEEI